MRKFRNVPNPFFASHHQRVLSDEYVESLGHIQNTDTILMTWDGVNPLFNAGILKTDLASDDGINIQIDEIQARDGDGLKLYDDGGEGIFIEDGGKVYITNKLDVNVPTGGALTAGYDNTASGQYSIAMGWLSTASAKSAIAMGRGAEANGMWSVAIGYQAVAEANYSFAWGISTLASGLYSMAMGNDTEASGERSFALGWGSTASGLGSIAMGRGIEAEADYVVAIALDNSEEVCSQANTLAIMGGKVGIETPTPTALLDINSDILRLRDKKTPSSAIDTGNAGDWCWDENYIYVCVNTNIWKRSALSTW